ETPGAPAPAVPQQAPPRPQASHVPQQPPQQHAAPTAVTHGAVASAVNGQMAGKLGELGLTPQQADAVLALSRDVVERGGWEVVPQLAEAIIKEEIARLTKEG